MGYAEHKKTYKNMDFYILNGKGQVVVTTHKPSENMDFNDCCAKFVSLIQERIQTDQFYFDGLELSIAGKDQRMYSYLATPDHKYLLEFGISFINTNVAKEFNYEDTVETLISNHADLEDLRVMTTEGYILNNDKGIESHKDLDKDLQKAFFYTTENQTESEVVKTNKDGSKEIHRFLYYDAGIEERGNATNRVVYAKYSNVTEQAMLKKNTAQFWSMLVIGLITAVILLIVILKLLNNTMRLATYDPLTHAYNRASYLQYMDEIIGKRDHYPVGLMLIDLDNFKQVNDVYGHAEGDNVLITVTSILKQVTGTEGYVVRFGGDEFAIVFEQATRESLKTYGEALLAEMRRQRDAGENDAWAVLSMSISATLQQEATEEEKELFDRADKALYISKNNGKDGYTYLSPETVTKEKANGKLDLI